METVTESGESSQNSKVTPSPQETEQNAQILPGTLLAGDVVGSIDDPIEKTEEMAVTIKSAWMNLEGVVTMLQEIKETTQDPLDLPGTRQATDETGSIDDSIEQARGIAATTKSVWMNLEGVAITLRETKSAGLVTVNDTNGDPQAWAARSRDLVKELTPALTTMSDFISLIYARYGRGEDLEQAIKITELLLEVTPIGTPSRVSVLSSLSTLFGHRYDRLREPEDLGKLIKYAEDTLDEAAEDSVHTRIFSSKLSNKLFARYARFGNLEDLTKAIDRAERALPVTNAFDLKTLNNLSNYFAARFERLGAVEDLESAICRAELGLTIAAKGSSVRLFLLSSMSVYLHTRYERFGSLDDLEKSIHQSQEVVTATLTNDPNRASRLSSLSNHLSSRYERLGNLEDIENAIDTGQQAVAATPDGHPDLASMLNSLSIQFFRRYERLGALEDLDKAIDRAQGAVAAAPIDHPDRAENLNSLSCFLSSRHERLGTLEALEKAIDGSHEAVVATPINHPSRPHRLMNLSCHLSRRYERLGNLEDLEKSIDQAQQAIAATPDGHPNLAFMLSRLSGALYSRYERLGNWEDLEKSTNQAQQAVAATPDGHPDLAIPLTRLSSSLYSRYERLETLRDLDKAIELAREVVAATPDGHPDRLQRLNNLNIYVSRRYKRVGTFEGFGEAIDGPQKAVAVIPDDHPARATILSSLSDLIYIRHEREGTVEDLDKAIELAHESLSVTPANHPDRSLRLNYLSIRLFRRFKELGTSEDLDAAIDRSQEAVASTPAEHPWKGTMLFALGALFIARYIRTDNLEDLESSLSANQGSWNRKNAPPSQRIDAAHSAALILSYQNRWHEANSILEEAVQLLPQVSLRSISRDDQQFQLSRFSQLATDTLFAGLQAGKGVHHCLKLLELSRGIILALVMDCRSDVSDLRVEYPALFERFTSLRSEVDVPFELNKLGPPSELEWKRRVQAVSELDETLNAIRGLPGFEGFQLPPEAEDLMAMARQGPIVIPYSSKFGSGAIIISKSTIKSLPLPDLEYEEIMERMRQLREDLFRGSRSTYPARNQQLLDILLWLWDTMVGPVLEELEFRPCLDETSLPRIWWIGVGALATLPFHAAGDHSPGSTHNTFSRAISSYIPTIKALSYVREGKLELLGRQDSKLLLVTMPTTPNKPRLTKVAGEASKIASVVSETTNTLLLESPSAAHVLEELSSCQAVHFACHGISDAKNPSNSHLLLFKNDGSERGAIDPLTAGAISGTNMRKMNAQIAYLSACHSASNQAQNLANESIHIASGFQLAGFSHVLATLWKSQDSAAEEVAVEFYRSLFDGHGDGHSKVSLSLHRAVKRLRDRIPRQPIVWASYIHTGA